MPSVKSDAWMRDFHQAVPTHAYVEELPAHAGPDDWGAIDDELRRTAQAAAPVVPGATGWPARPPPEESPPPSRSRSGIEVRQSDLDALGFILDKLRDESASLNAQAAAKQEFKLQLSRDELQRLEEQIRARLERERRPASPSEQKVLDKVRTPCQLPEDVAKPVIFAGRMAVAPKRRPAPQVRVRNAPRRVVERVRKYGKSLSEGARLDDDHRTGARILAEGGSGGKR